MLGVRQFYGMPEIQDRQNRRLKKKNEVLQGLTSSYAATSPRKEGKDKVP